MTGQGFGAYVLNNQPPTVVPLLIAILLWMILPAALLAFEAHRKGYHPAAWIFAGGIVGYAILAFLPDTAPLLGRERPDAESRRRLGNQVGVGITIFSVLLAIASGLVFSSSAFRPLPPAPREPRELGSVAFSSNPPAYAQPERDGNIHPGSTGALRSRMTTAR